MSETAGTSFPPRTLSVREEKGRSSSHHWTRPSFSSPQPCRKCLHTRHFTCSTCELTAPIIRPLPPPAPPALTQVPSLQQQMGSRRGREGVVRGCQEGSEKSRPEGRARRSDSARGAPAGRRWCRETTGGGRGRGRGRGGWRGAQPRCVKGGRRLCARCRGGRSSSSSSVALAHLVRVWLVLEAKETAAHGVVFCPASLAIVIAFVA